MKEFTEVRIQGLEFVGEQDGPYERVLKSKLSELFSRKVSVTRAYLARAKVAGGDTSVILCLVAEVEPDETLIEEIGSAFASLFGATEHLDIVFIGGSSENQLRQICQPFYSL
jgi:hypothetical protein